MEGEQGREGKLPPTKRNAKAQLERTEKGGLRRGSTERKGNYGTENRVNYVWLINKFLCCVWVLQSPPSLDPHGASEWTFGWIWRWRWGWVRDEVVLLLVTGVGPINGHDSRTSNLPRKTQSTTKCIKFSIKTRHKRNVEKFYIPKTCRQGVEEGEKEA